MVSAGRTETNGPAREWVGSCDAYLDSADGLQPGGPFHRRANMPMYSRQIKNSGTQYEDKKKDTC